MGQEILYCSKCQTRLLGSEFEKGKAFRIGDKAACAPCAKEMLAALPPQERDAILAASVKDPRRTSSPSLQAIRPPPLPTETPSRGTRLATDSSTRLKTTVRRTAPASRAALYVGIGAAAAVAFAAIVAMTVSRAKVEPRPVPPTPAPTAAGTSTPEPPRPPSPKTVPPAEREAAAKKSLQEARDFAAKNSADLPGQLGKFKTARWDADGTPVLAEAQKELDQILKKVVDSLGTEMAPIEELVRGACGREEFKEALDLLEKARKRFDLPEWSALIDAGLQKVREEAGKAYAPLREEALKARAAGAEARVKEISERVSRWGLTPLAEDLARALAEKPPTAAPPVSPSLAAYHKRWEEALAPLAIQDYGEAVRALKGIEPEGKEAREEHARDLEDLRLAAGLIGEATQALSKWPKGRPIKLRYLGEVGNVLEAEGPVGRADAQQIEIAVEGTPFTVPLPEIAATTLAEIFKGRAEAKPDTDARAVAAFLALEGEEEASRPLGEKYAARARRLASEPGEKERAARGLFWPAEDEFRSVSTRAAAIGKYQALLAEHAETAFVRRNRALIASRPEGVKEYFFFPHDLVSAGAIGLASNPKVPSCLMSCADSPSGKDNYVEFAIYIPAETVVRCWIYAGACCAETFTFYAQVTDLVVPNPSSPKEMIPAGPGENASVLVKHSLMFLKRLHAMHGGPKAPERWAWIELPLPKFATSGVKKVRILTEQQGFAVAYVLVSPARKEFPREAEMKEIAKAHAALAPAPAAAATATGTILREQWNDIQGHLLSELLKNPNYPNSPSSTAPLTSFDAPVDCGDNYGARIRGYVHPPQTGLYTFWIVGDDQYELWLSPDDDPGKKKKIAWDYNARGHRDFKDEVNLKSAPIPLAAGRRYYVEALHKEGGGGDHVAVGWRLPDGADERPIPGTRLSPWGAGPAAAAPSPKPGRPRFYRAINLNGPPLTIDNLPWEGKDAPNVACTGDHFENLNVALNPPTDANRTRMIRASVFNRGGSFVKISAVPKGTYQVYLYVWEDNASQTFDLSVNGKVVQQRYSSGNGGHWDKLGPWTVDAADGAIEVKATQADANFSGIEVWRLR